MTLAKALAVRPALRPRLAFRIRSPPEVRARAFPRDKALPWISKTSSVVRIRLLEVCKVLVRRSSVAASVNTK